MASKKGIYGFSDWDNAFLNQQEKDYITGLRQQAEAGQISWGTANKAAESVRSKYGYAGGSDGSGYIAKPVSIDTKYDNFEKRAEIDRQKQKVLGSTFEEFTQGDDYAALLDKYTTAGQRAMDDTVGTVSTRTGGLASSFAVAAGQQAFNQYMEGLDDAARELYQQEYEKERQRLQMLQDEEAQDYSRYLDNISIQTGERDHQREVARNILDRNNYKTEYEDSRKDTEWNQGITEAEITGYMPGGTPIYQTVQDAEAKTLTQVSNAQNQVEALLSKGKTIADIDPALVAKAKEGSTGWSDDYLALLESQGQQTGTYTYTSDVPADEGDDEDEGVQPSLLTSETSVGDLQMQTYNHELSATNKSYGSSYDLAFATAKKMQADGKSAEEIAAYLDTISEKALTTEGGNRIMANLGLL